MRNRKDEVLVAMQQALLGEVSARLRAVAVFYDDESIEFTCYFDGNISEEDQESMSCVETELMAVFPGNHSINYSLHRIDYPGLIPKDGIWVFLRREN